MFQESYLINYMDFKTYIVGLPDSKAIVDVFTTEIESSTKEKFLSAIFKAVEKYIALQLAIKRRHQVPYGTQTNDTYRGKVHNVLMSEKNSSERMQIEIQRLKKVISGYSMDKVDAQRKLEEKDLKIA